MYINFVIIILVLLLGCGEQVHREVSVHKTVKVFSEGYHDQAENYTFKWQPPIGPNNEKMIFQLKNDMLIFTPVIVGNYTINLSIEDISEQVVSKEIFYFKAIAETTKISIVKPNKKTQFSIKPANDNKLTVKGPPENQITQSPNKRKKQRTNSKITKIEYAIQISSWPSLEESRKYQLELIDEGFDAYTQRFYYKEKDEVWYRVRVGNFRSKSKALIVKKQIESITGITTWLDNVSSK